MPATTAATPPDESLTFCHYGPSRTVPSLSSFALKLETYLKMTEIPYKAEHGFKTSSKGKVPFIKHEGKEIADTNFIIPYLNKKYEKDLDSNLNDQEKAVSLAFKRLIEENLYWTLIHSRWIENFSSFSKQLPATGMRKKLLPIAGPLLLKPKVNSSLNGHGMGRHSSEEIHEIMQKDLNALSTYLGPKQFFMGEEPSEIDASLFGFLAQVMYASPGYPHETFIKENLQNLADYTDRMKEKYFSDWEQLLIQEKKKDEEAEEEKKVDEAEQKDADKNGSDKNEEKKEENGSKVEEVAQKEAEEPQTQEKKENGDQAEEKKEEAASAE